MMSLSERFRLAELIELESGKCYLVHDGGGSFVGVFKCVQIRSGLITLAFERTCPDGLTATVLIPGNWKLSVKENAKIISKSTTACDGENPAENLGSFELVGEH